jgi:hypothetical protein
VTVLEFISRNVSGEHAAYIFRAELPEDGGNMFLGNTDIYLKVLGLQP